MVDVGYPNIKGYLTPYKGERYHLPEFQRGSQPQNAQEMFNHRHSSLRSVIERTFGVWKERWHILNNMPSYKFTTQVSIVSATMALHNFIRRAGYEDYEIDEMIANPDWVAPDAPDVPSQDERHGPALSDDNEMGVVRDTICAHILLGS